MKTQPIAYILSGLDNDSYMLGDETRKAATVEERKFFDWRFVKDGKQHPATRPKWEQKRGRESFLDTTEVEAAWQVPLIGYDRLRPARLWGIDAWIYRQASPSIPTSRTLTKTGRWQICFEQFNRDPSKMERDISQATLGTLSGSLNSWADRRGRWR